MLIAPTRKFRKNRKPVKQTADVPPAPATLMLFVAIYDQTALTLLMQFDRDVDVTGLDASQIQVMDGQFNNHRYVASGAGVEVSGAVVTLNLVVAGTASGGQVQLSASASTGIVAADDGGTWAGVSDLVLPFT